MTSYIIYDIDTLHIATDRGATMYFKTLRGAKISWSRRFNKNPKLAIADLNTFHNEIDYDITVKNLLSGLPCTIKKSEKGGCCDPSTERYHCM